MSDSYTWVVYYRDGSTVGQINAEGVDDGSWGSVDARNVAVVRLEPTNDQLPVHGMMVPEGAKAFLTFRRSQELNPNTGEVIIHPALTIIGWTRGDARAFLFVDHLGNTILSDDVDALP